VATLFGTGQFASGMFLQQASGASGNISFSMYASNSNGGSAITATVAFASATTAKVVAGVFDGSTMTTYLDGTAGTPVDASTYANPTLLQDSVLRGDMATGLPTSSVVLASGGRGKQTLETRAYTIDNEALFTGAGLMVFEKGLSSGAITAITAMYA